MYLRAAYSFQHNLTGLVDSFLELYENYLFITDLVWFLGLKPTISSGSKKFPLEIKRGIEFKNVWFRYKEDQPWVLRGINFSIKIGESVAIVGENGAGKTTLIKLLCRFYEPQKGEILIDGVNIKEYHREGLWENLAVLFQDFEKGVNPSSDQWQRIGFFRVLLRDAQIVVLDEPTSNVDAKAKEEIFKEIGQFAKNKILILISHRFSTVRQASKILVMDKGRIIEEGSHKQLMTKKGTYAELFQIQAKGYQ